MKMGVIDLQNCDSITEFENYDTKVYMIHQLLLSMKKVICQNCNKEFDDNSPQIELLTVSTFGRCVECIDDSFSGRLLRKI